MTTLSLSQTPDAVNLQLRQYQNWTIAFSYCEQDGNGNYDLNMPINLTGYTPILQFRENAQSRVAVLELAESLLTQTPALKFRLTRALIALRVNMFGTCAAFLQLRLNLFSLVAAWSLLMQRYLDE
jgi:hypothetical protein